MGFSSLGERLRIERKRRGVSQRQLAERIGLSPSLISQIETGRSKPSVSTLYAMVTELGISLDRLFSGSDEAIPGGHPRRPSDPVVRPDTRQVIELESGVRWERLTSDPEDGVDFLFVVYDVGGSSSGDERLMRHPGREYGYVISGRLGVQVGFARYALGPGDSIAFDSTQPHRLWNLGGEPVQAVWCVVGRRD